MLKRKRKIILAPPYSGALYAYFDDCMAGRPTGHREIMDHPYYKKLFGMYTEQTRDIAITLSVLYDQIFIPPADAYFPRKEIGFSTSWDEFISFQENKREELKVYMADSILNNLIRGQKEWEKEQLLNELSYCLYLSERFECPIFCGKGTKLIIDRIGELNNKYIDKESSFKIEFVEKYITISGFMFDITDLDIYEKVKYNSEIRGYSEKFIEILESKADIVTTDSNFKELMRESINKNDICSNIKAGFNISSLVFGVGGLAPVVGMPLSVTSLGLAFGEKLISNKVPNWYELGPKIECISKLELMKNNIF